MLYRLLDPTDVSGPLTEEELRLLRIDLLDDFQGIDRCVGDLADVCGVLSRLTRELGSRSESARTLTRRLLADLLMPPTITPEGPGDDANQPTNQAIEDAAFALACRDVMGVDLPPSEVSAARAALDQALIDDVA